ncbi:MAG: hypothetical protein SGCHY_004708, partial [Lobulomycetales sp.]
MKRPPPESDSDSDNDRISESNSDNDSDNDGGSEQGDYMSEAFLDAASSTKDTHSIRPASYSKRSNSRTTPSSLLASGLATPLAPDNKGFRMLQKMGFRPGDSLGAKETCGITQPIALGGRLSQSRSGLGMYTPAAATVSSVGITPAAVAGRPPGAAAHDRDGAGAAGGSRPARDGEADFKSRTLAAARRKRVQADVARGRAAVQQLDEACEIPRSELWPVEEGQEDPTGDEDDMLEWVIEHLRQVHYYCMYCGDRYADQAEMAEICPGPARSMHEG